MAATWLTFIFPLLLPTSLAFVQPGLQFSGQSRTSVHFRHVRDEIAREILEVDNVKTYKSKESVISRNDAKNVPSPTLARIEEAFPNAVTNQEIVRRVSRALRTHGYSEESTLLATSFCCDELARPLEHEFAKVYGDAFLMGGLAGFPMGGLTSFGAMAAHIPDDGSCLIVYGPHVGVSSTGEVGTVERRGRLCGGSCCGSAAAAAAYVSGIRSSSDQVPTYVEDPLDAQQFFVGNMLLPYADRLANAKDPNVELPVSLFDAQKKLMSRILKEAASKANGQIALVGGIQINTPSDMEDYFLPLQMDLVDSDGNTWEFSKTSTTARP